MTLPFNIPPFLVESYAIPIEDSRKLSRHKYSIRGKSFYSEKVASEKVFNLPNNW